MADPFAEWPPEHYETPTEHEEHCMAELVTVTLHTVLSSKGEAIRGFLDPQVAWDVAERDGLKVGTKTLAVGDRVNVRFATHPKTGTIVRFAGKRMVVRLATKKGGPLVEKSFPIEF